MFGLVDANSFYASAEKVFDPTIRDKPVVVLTNNDGCICAMCPLAKQSGVNKFVPYHTVKKQLQKINAVIRSSNYELYADLSSKMMEIISRFCITQHIYSIDESFITLPADLSEDQCLDVGKKIKYAVWRETRLPVCVGLAGTPTLAKVANHRAKMNQLAQGVHIIHNEATRRVALADFPVSKVWGIGRKLSLKLDKMGINTAWQLANTHPRIMRKHFSVDMEKTIRELNGVPCLQWDNQRKDKQQIYSTRAFGEKVSNIEYLRHALAFHGQQVAKKVRAQKCLVKSLTCFAHSNPFKDGYFRKQVYHQFTHPTADSRHIVHVASEAARQLYKSGVLFHKVGIGAIEIVSASHQQLDLLSPDTSNHKLMACMDRINHRFGRGTMSLASAQKKGPWTMKRQFLSPQYTTRWSDIPVIRCS